MAYQKYKDNPTRREPLGGRDHIQHIENALKGVVDQIDAGEGVAGIDNRVPLRRFRAALVNGTGPVDIVAIGDSITESGGGSGGDFSTRWSQVMVDTLRRDWQPDGVPGSPRGYVSATAPTWTFAGATAAYSLGGLQMRARSVGEGGSATYTATGTGFRLLFQQRTSGSATVSIDGGEPVTLPIAGSALEGGHSWESPVLSRGEHTLTVNSATSGTVIEGAYAYDGDHEKGIRLWESGNAGTDTTFWLAQTRWAESVVRLNPSLVILALGVNDYAKNTGHEQFATNLHSLVTLVRGSLAPRPSVAFLVPYEREATGATFDWAGYRQAYFDVAAEDGDIALLDMSQTVGDRVEAAALGILRSDLVHPTPLGNKLIGADVAGQLAP